MQGPACWCHAVQVYATLQHQHLLLFFQHLCCKTKSNTEEVNKLKQRIGTKGIKCLFSDLALFCAGSALSRAMLPHIFCLLSTLMHSFETLILPQDAAHGFGGVGGDGGGHSGSYAGACIEFFIQGTMSCRMFRPKKHTATCHMKLTNLRVQSNLSCKTCQKETAYLTAFSMKSMTNCKQR